MYSYNINFSVQLEVSQSQLKEATKEIEDLKMNLSKAEQEQADSTKMAKEVNGIYYSSN